MLSIIRAAPVEIVAAAETEVPHDEPPRRFVRHVIDGNIAVVPLGRFGLTYQLSPARHHALVFTAYRQMPWLTSFLNGGLVGLGGEIGWRIYSGSRGPTGFFIGAAALAAYHTANDTPWFATYGAAADAGVAFLLGRQLHFTVGGGAQVTHSEIDNGRVTDLARLLVGTGVFPRVTIALGHAP